IEIFNIMGIKVLTTKNKEIDISGLVSGSYIIQILTDKKIMGKKFIKN
ncbi:MAG: T9SS type A sorting domain-containing protein, partial [Bacteroidales bacterium]|nr:T9SS type A sorting domain-containing protein [Bacteroidales bacterium]